MEDAAVDVGGEQSVVQPANVEVEAPDWREEAGVQDNPSFEKFKSSADLANSYTQLERHQHNQVRFPSEDAGKDTVDKFNVKMSDHGYHKAPDRDDTEGMRTIQTLLGMPKEAAGYKFDEVDGFSDPEGEGALKTFAHSVGMTSEQANKLNTYLGGGVAAQNFEIAQEAEKGMAELKGQWGAAFDHKIEVARNTVGMLEERIPGISAYFDEQAQKGGDHNFIRILDVLGEALGESTMMKADPRVSMTPDEARERIHEVQNNPEHPANPANEGKRGYQQARDKFMQLYRVAYN